MARGAALASFATRTPHPLIHLRRKRRSDRSEISLLRPKVARWGSRVITPFQRLRGRSRLDRPERPEMPSNTRECVLSGVRGYHLFHALPRNSSRSGRSGRDPPFYAMVTGCCEMCFLCISSRILYLSGRSSPLSYKRNQQLVFLRKRTTTYRIEREMLAQMIRSTEAVKREMSIQGLLEWTFRVEHAQLDLGDAASIVGMSPPHVGMEYVMIERARLGCHIDGGGHSDPHPDADVVASALAVLPDGHGGRAMAIAIAEYARAGRVPDAMAGVKTRCIPKEWRMHKHGKYAKTELIEVIEYGRRGRRMRREVRWCPVMFTPTPSQIAAARRFYLAWWGALLDLAATFRVYDGLSGHTVTDAMPPMTPWTQKNV